MALTAGAFVADWVAVATDRRPVELVAKPASMIALTATAIDAGLLDRPWGRQSLAGMGFGLGGDVALLWGEHEPAFLTGLSSFLAGHLCYIAAFRRIGIAPTPWLVPGALAIAATLAWTWEALPAIARQDGALAAVPVAAYMGVISAMSLAAWGTGDVRAGVGSSLFVLSDAVIAKNAFVAPRRHAGLEIMTTYLLGQSLIASAAVGAEPRR